jgi:serine protease inhibitor
VNAIYFKGIWKHPFKTDKTATATFFIDNVTSTNFLAMALTEKFKTIAVNEINARVLQLPYVNDKISMIIILPDLGSTLRQVETKLKDFDATSLLKKLNSTESYSTSVILPKFEMSFEVKGLMKKLQSMGVSSLFDETNSNLSNISDEPLYVSKMSHNAVIKVNEEGSEAAAVTVVELQTRSIDREFIVNRPFLFYIVDHQSNIPLFVGRIIDPNGKLKLRSSNDDPARRSDVVEDPSIHA